MIEELVKRISNIERALGHHPEAPLIMLSVSTNNVSNPPTDAELDTAFGAPSTLPEGFMALVDDNGAASAVWLVSAVNGSWWYEALTKAV